MHRLFALLALFFTLSTALAQAPAFVTHTITFDVGDTAWVADVYEPSTGASKGTAIVAHGFIRSRERHRDLGRALAAAGVTAIVPDLPNPADPWGNSTALVDLAHALERGVAPLRPLRPASLVLIGTSAGGFATVMAAAELPEAAGWIGLDPVDRTGAAKSAAARLALPAIVFQGEGSTCNLFGSARAIADAAPTLVRLRKFEGASHCDFEAPTNRLCAAFCGGSNADRERDIVEATVDAARELLARAEASHGQRSDPVQAHPEGGD